jgi:hypothetical protein
MNISTRTRIFGATAALGTLLALTACGTETVADTGAGTQPVTQSRVYPPINVPVWTPGPNPSPGVLSADAAERRAAADKARRDRADTLRWARGTQQENKLKHAGHPGQP